MKVSGTKPQCVLSFVTGAVSLKDWKRYWLFLYYSVKKNSSIIPVSRWFKYIYIFTKMMQNTVSWLLRNIYGWEFSQYTHHWQLGCQPSSRQPMWLRRHKDGFFFYRTLSLTFHSRGETKPLLSWCNQKVYEVSKTELISSLWRNKNLSAWLFSKCCSLIPLYIIESISLYIGLW